MEAQQYLDQVPRYMLATPYWRELGQTPTLRIACKTGFFTGTRVDAGIVRFAASDGGFAYAVANHELADVSFGPEAEGVIINGFVGKALMSYWWPAEVELPVFRLWVARRHGGARVSMVEVVNSTPEPDSTRRHYFLRVPLTSRPVGRRSPGRSVCPRPCAPRPSRPY